MHNFQRLNLAQRRLIFFLIAGGILMGLIAVTAALVGSLINPGRTPAFAVGDSVLVNEFAALPDDDAYPAAVVAAPDGTVYTGSFKSGAVWAITPDGVVSEIPNLRNLIGVVSGLAMNPAGDLIIVDQIDSDPRTGGGEVHRVSLPFGSGSTLLPIPDGWTTPDDVTVDREGRIYVTDRGRNEVWRYESSADGTTPTLWWTPPAAAEGSPRGAVTGIAYDPVNDVLWVTDPDLNLIYRVPISGEGAEVRYTQSPNVRLAYGFDGLDVSEDGTLYLAAFGQNALVRLLPGAAEPEVVAAGFRGLSDVAFGPNGELYATNFDQTALVRPFVQPRLPFGIDVVTVAFP